MEIDVITNKTKFTYNFSLYQRLAQRSPIMTKARLLVNQRLLPFS